MERVLARTTLKAPPQDRAYWLTRTVQERIAAVELLRQQVLAANADVEPRLQKVCRVAQLDRR